MLKQAFNAVIALHSKPQTLKRLGTPDLYSPIRVSPSNYFRFLDGPSATTIHGREFVIPLDTISGTRAQKIAFSIVPTEGKYFWTYNGNNTSHLEFDAVAATIQTALRLLTGLGDVTVTGDYTSGFVVSMYGIQSPMLLTATKVVGDEIDADMTVNWTTSVPWPSPIIKRGDKIIHSFYGSLALDEVVEMVDVGGDVMGYRVRCE